MCILSQSFAPFLQPWTGRTARTRQQHETAAAQGHTSTRYDGGGEERGKGKEGSYRAHWDLKHNRDVLSLIVADGVGREGGDLDASHRHAGAREGSGQSSERRVGSLGRLCLERTIDPIWLEIKTTVQGGDVLVEEPAQPARERMQREELV